MTEPVGAPERVRYRTAFWGLLVRDARVLRRGVTQFLLRTVMQPFLFVFVFLYVFPNIGAGIHGPGSASFGTILLPGLVAVAIMFQGIQAVGLPLVNEFNQTREIEDRVMAPLPTNLVAFEKILFGAMQSALAAVIVFPMVLFFPNSNVHPHVNPVLLVAEIVVACLSAGALGLAIGTGWSPRQVPLIFSVIVIPITFLGCIYYPWAALHPIRWLQIVILANPLVYVSEGLRGAITPNLEHMAWPVSLGVLTVIGAGLTWLGMRGFRRRVLG
ncbi:MAG TPA: ABC transporter permease [Acidimicrobiales bacterium]|nr:ABC transporter permease [Acidimicrobiales bacterium]